MRLTPQRWLMLGGIATVLVMIIMYTGIISPARSREASLSAALANEQTAITSDRGQLAQLQALAATQPAQLAKAFRVSQAIPLGPQTPGMIIQLQALAKAADVTLTDVRTVSTTPVNSLTATQYEVDVVGRFFNVDDFIYRVHHQVNVSSRGAVAIKGRLFAITGVQLSLAGASGTTTPGASNSVMAALQVITFSTTSSGATGAGTPGGSSASPGTGASTSSSTTTMPTGSGSPG